MWKYLPINCNAFNQNHHLRRFPARSSRDLQKKLTINGDILWECGILEIFVGCNNFAKKSFDSLAIIRLVSQAFSPSLSRLPWCNGVQYCGEGVTGDFPIDASKHHHSLKMLPLLQMVGGPNNFNKIFFLSIFFYYIVGVGYLVRARHCIAHCDLIFFIVSHTIWQKCISIAAKYKCI